MWFGVRLLVAALVICVVLTEVRAVYEFQGWSGRQTDFYGTVWQPDRAVLDGESPYEPASTERPASVYPPPGFLPFIALATVSPSVAHPIFQILLLAASVLTLVALGVRAPESYALWLSSALVVIPVLIGNATPLVVLAAALCWRWRDRPLRAGLALAVGTAAKLFVIPMTLWLIATRRYRAAGIAVAGSASLILVAWGLIGLDGIRDYPRILRSASAAYGADGPFVQGLGRQLGLGADTAIALGVATALALGLLVVMRRSRDLSSVTLSLMVCLALAPVAWVFYAGLVVIPLAAARLPWPYWLSLQAFWISWWYSPLDYRSVSLSVVTLAVTIGVCILATRTARASDVTA